MISKNSMQKTVAKMALVAGTVASILWSLSSHAVSLTTYRIYLDDNNRTESFIMFTRGSLPEQCTLDFKHFNFNDTGEMTLNRDKKSPENSAEPWVRYSPRNFVIQPGKPQTVRFAMRRKPNSEPAEYRSYIAVLCEDIIEKKSTVNGEIPKDRAQVSVKPLLVQNVPLIVRTGKLNVSASFENLVVEGNKLKGVIKRSGDRSIYGRLSLINKNTDEEIVFKDTISIYTETSTYAFEFEITGKNMPAIDDLLVRFTEDDIYGGELIFEKSVK